jgi:hypothetical protein
MTRCGDEAGSQPPRATTAATTIIGRFIWRDGFVIGIVVSPPRLLNLSAVDRQELASQSAKALMVVSNCNIFFNRSYLTFEAATQNHVLHSDTLCSANEDYNVRSGVVSGHLR